MSTGAAQPQRGRGRGQPRSGEANCAQTEVGLGLRLAPAPRARQGASAASEGRRLARDSWTLKVARAGPAPGSPAPRCHGVAAARGHARRSPPVESLAPSGSRSPRVGPGGSVGGGGGGGWARRRRAAPPWEVPRPSSSDQYPFQENKVLRREASSGPWPRRQTAVSSFLCGMIHLLTHPEKHSPPLASLRSGALPKQCHC